MHLLATFLVAFGTTLSAFWILALNSWMQTPAGYEIVDGAFHVGDWLAVIFNPSFPYRLTHMLLASALTGAFLLAGLSAWQLLRRRRARSRRRRCCASGLTLAALLIPLQIFVGDLHGLNTLEHQPAKIAAMEGIWETERGAPLLLFAMPDESERAQPTSRSRFPSWRSLILTHELDGEVKGLNEFRGAHPPVAAGVLRLSHHGRHRRADAADQLARLLAVPARGWRAARCRAGCCGCSPA